MIYSGHNNVSMAHKYRIEFRGIQRMCRDFHLSVEWKRERTVLLYTIWIDQLREPK